MLKFNFLKWSQPQYTRAYNLHTQKRPKKSWQQVKGNNYSPLLNNNEKPLVHRVCEGGRGGIKTELGSP